jgi:tRNA-splicing ligase RtcB (3'-phosphate/5'-hydroxy nucleic acid ligase)
MIEYKIKKDGVEKVIDIEPKKLTDFTYIIEKQDPMNVPVKIFADKKLIEKMQKDACLKQGVNVACLPGIKKFSFMMPDAHQGYGFSIGGVAAFDKENGVISPGGIGFDINCGVRLLRTDAKKEDIEPKIEELLDALFKNIPPGVGKQSKIHLSQTELDKVLKNGASWAVENNFGNEEDLENCEQNGKMELADPNKVSTRAKKRGLGQLGTLGAGNHFLEIQYVHKIFNKEVAEAWGIKDEGQIFVMIHCGSRGLGHQVCSDYLRKMEDTFPEIADSLPEKDLIYAPANSQLAKDYFAAMSCAANYAWANRHIIAHEVRNSFKEIFQDKVKLHTIYDVAHNIAKLEKHTIDGKEEEVWIHRKGATRAFAPGRIELSEKYQKTGQPIILPGSMGTSSYLLVGTQDSMTETFGSTAHGAGRLLSRKAANQKFRGEKIKQDLEKQHIHIKAASWKGITEEAPGAYKDVDEVVEVSDKSGIGKIVVQLKPLGVIKG